MGIGGRRGEAMSRPAAFAITTPCSSTRLKRSEDRQAVFGAFYLRFVKRA
jgi:hypothetical protein